MTGKADAVNFMYRFKYVIALALVAVLVTAQASSAYSTLPTPTVATYNNLAGVRDCSYVISTNGSTIYAQNCNTGALDYSGSSASSIIESALAASGGLVFVKAGTYTISSQIDLPSNIILQGEGIGKTQFFVSNSANILPFKNSDSTNGNVNIILRDFTIDLNGANQSSNGQIGFSGVSNSTIDHVEIKNPRTFAILWQAIGDPVTGLQSKFNKITNNVFSGGAVTNDRLVINIQDSIVSNNVFTNSPAGSNYDLSGGRSTKHVIISNNIFADSGQVGIGLEDPQYVQIVNNNFYNLDSHCIQVIRLNTSVNASDVLIANNYMDNCGNTSGSGINLRDIYNLKVANNYINDTASGCIVSSVSTVTSVSNVQITGNQVSYCGRTGSSTDGISVSGAKNADISSNIVSYARRDGIITNGLSNGLLTNNVVFNNNKGGAADPRGVGIGSSGGSPAGVLISGNNVFYTSGNDGTMNRAIYTGNGDNNIATNNRINGTYLASPSISISGSNSKVLRNIGFVTENKGTSTINNGSTSVVVTHGLSYTPSASECTVTWTENPTNDPGNWWISSITSSQFTVNVRADPGASNLDFGWACRRV